jgi:N-acetylglucosamine-6-phosphate deacetylase
VIRIGADHAVIGGRLTGPVTVTVTAGADGGRIAGIGPARDAADIRLPAGAILSSGFVDLQVNGGGGVLFNDQTTVDGIAAIAAAHGRFGTRHLLPTLITDTRDVVARAIAAVRAAIMAGVPGIAGIHLEGPFISPARPGIHRPDRIVSFTAEDVDLLAGLGPVGATLVTLAPECVPEGAIAALVTRGVTVFAGHTEASGAVMARAISEGLSGVTHLHNAMRPMTAREPGVVGAALGHRLMAGLILDNVHVDAVSARASLHALGARRIALVTDAMPTAGSTITGFDLMGRAIRREGDRLIGPDGTLAGAHLTMDQAARNALALTGNPAAALTMATLTPARAIGRARRFGALRVGASARLIALDAALNLLPLAVPQA